MYPKPPPSRTRWLYITAAIIILCFVVFNSRLWGTVSPSADLINEIDNSTLGFQEILVVGLPSRTDRRDGMILQAALSSIHVNFIDGVMGDTILEKAIPNGPDHKPLAAPSIGSWRGHLNVIQEVVRRNLTTALILEDDVDWDVRIRSQLHDFALSSRALIQPLVGTNTYADPTYPHPEPDSASHDPEISFDALPATERPRVSPYGDDWDVMWIGHCGMTFPFEDNRDAPRGRVIHVDDDTVAEKRYLWSFNNPFKLVDDYPEHTRAVHHAQEGVCTLGYAVSQRGAQKLLYEVGLKDVSDAFDILMRFFCNGGKGRKPHRCLTVQPSLFHHFRPAGSIAFESDIGDHGDGFREREYTDMVRWSVRLNAETIMDGGTVFHDQYPNGDP
ncbi:hypothetical protein DL764_004951 [Monosporascus ibericus]|uniref:Glycosyl transferase family 25 domain-containing protein n=1 Tax=Monosporascus ibericus TaxID=155417 RepID=A0A4V1XAS0_9PEZI|nr:hypothetical protein DL764_004951 [Monosporascus ibericus]